jgi:hypothetical protein
MSVKGTRAAKAAKRASDPMASVFDEAKVAKAEKAKATKNGAKGAKPAKSCECGCGGQTKGGRFLIGHDAKLKSRLINEVLDGKGAGAKAAEAQITKLGWTSFLEKSRGSRDRKQAAKAKAAAEKSAA